MKQTIITSIIFGMGFAFIVLLFAGVSLENKFQTWYWNNFYYAKMRMPDGNLVELKDANDLTFTQWKVKFLKHWLDSQKPVDPNYPVLFDNAMYSILEKDVNDLILYWKPDDARIEITPVRLKTLKIVTVQMTNVFE